MIERLLADLEKVIESKSRDTHKFKVALNQENYVNDLNNLRQFIQYERRLITKK